MKIAVVGAGAMGSIYAGLFAEAGHEVWAVDLWPEHVAAINAHGLRLEGASGDRTISSLRAVSDVPPADLYVIATKASGVAAAAKAIAVAAPPEALVLTIQNGLGAAERVGAHLPLDRVLIGVAEGFGASLKAPGRAHHNAMKRIRLGEIEGGETDRLARLTVLWREAGFTAESYADINRLIWEKFVCNVAFSAPCAVFDCPIGAVTGDPERWAVSLGCAVEAWRCGLAEGVAFSFDDPAAYVADFARLMPEASPSLRLDLLARRPSEIDAINGMVPVIGVRHGIATPYNETLAAVVRAREGALHIAKERPSPEPLRERD